MRFVILVAILSVMLPAAFGQGVVGTSSLRAPAVILSNNTGSLTTINLTVYKGNGTVEITGPTVVGQSFSDSVRAAAQYATQYLNLNFSNYTFDYHVVGTDNVSGPSGGAAMTLLAISALSNMPLQPNFTITGTISPNGSIGLIGGAYDKASAAKSSGMRYLLVPGVPNTSLESELYTLIESRYGIPLIPVSNISAAYAYAFYNVKDPWAYADSYDFYINYSISNLPTAPLNCSNACNESAFTILSNDTSSLADSEISGLGKNFTNVSIQLNRVLSQSQSIAGKGYLYTGDDYAFLDYVDTFFFSSAYLNISSGMAVLDAVHGKCASIQPPVMTSANYEYVIGGELRQAWGIYNSNSTIAEYNASIMTSDDVLIAMRQAGESNAWCSASTYMYNIAQGIGGTPVRTNSSQLSTLAAQRVNQAITYSPGSQYTAVAQEALAVRNYPLAILDSDYAFASANASSISSKMNVSQLYNMSTAMADNSTFGVWATQFANEAYFYAYQATQAKNQTTAHTYAAQALSTAMLAHQISVDTQAIHNSMAPGTGQQVVPGSGGSGTSSTPTSVVSQAGSVSASEMSFLESSVHELIVLIGVVLVIVTIVLISVVHLYLSVLKELRKQKAPHLRRK
jgi:hypothetical protein